MLKSINKNDGYSMYRFCLPLNNANMYVYIKDGRALIIDCYYDEDLLHILKENNVEDITILLTHEHWDHASGVEFLRDNFCNCVVLCGKHAEERLKDSRKNMSCHYKALITLKHGENNPKIEEANIKPFAFSPDIALDDNECYIWEDFRLKVKLTPGHTPGSICVFLNDMTIFTGDSLVNGNTTITRFPGGSKRDFESITVPFIEGLKKDILVLPGHGDPSKLENIINFMYNT